MKSIVKSFLGGNQKIDLTPFSPPIFLTGCMRSGTTFFAKLLSEHQNIQHIKGELLDPWTKLGGIDCLASRVYADREEVNEIRRSNMIAFFERCRLYNSSSSSFFERLNDRVKNGSGGIFNHDNSILLNKSVHLINRTDFLLNLIEGSKVILIIRPLESQVASLKLHFKKNAQKGWFYKTPEKQNDSWITSSDPLFKGGWIVNDLFEKWFDLNKIAIQDLKRNERSKYLIVDYTNLVNNPENVLKRVFTFLGLKDQKIKFSEEKKLKRKVFNSNTNGNPINAWKQVLSKGEIIYSKEIKEKRADDLKFIEDNFDV